MSSWVEHCKNYSKTNGCSYKDAMKLARPSYQSGGKLIGKNAGRKAKNTIKEVADIAPMLAPLVAPEIGVGVAIGSKIAQKKMATAQKKKKKLGSKVNPYLSGGSFRVAGESFEGGSFRVAGESFEGGCMSCKKMKPGHTESSVIAPNHPASNPLKSKSYKRLIVEN